MEDWRTLYQQKLTTAEEAVKHIKSGDRVVVTHATGEPILLTDAMVANAEQYENVEVVHMVAMGKAEYCLPENSKHFRHNSLFLGGSTRRRVRRPADRADQPQDAPHHGRQLYPCQQAGLHRGAGD